MNAFFGGNKYRKNFVDVFGEKKRKQIKIKCYEPKISTTKKGKVKRTLCPHCATKNVVKISEWESICQKCGWSKI
jgi:hypothetical protein